MSLALYVWENILSDYTSGLVVAVARSEDEALAAIKARDHVAADAMQWHRDGLPPADHVIPLNEATQARAFLVWGGG
jgi:hypothetical protein